MDRLLRSCLQVSNVPDAEECVYNWHKLEELRLDFHSEEDKKIHDYLSDFYNAMSSPPDFGIVREFFEKKDDIETCSRLDEIKKSQHYIRANFLALARSEMDAQQLRNFVVACRDAATIAEHGINLDKAQNGKKVLRGVLDAMGWMFERMSSFSHFESGEKLEGFVNEDEAEFLEEYEEAAKVQTYVGRNIFGLDPVDNACEGHKTGEFWVHCAYPGELKCVVGSSTVFDHRVGRRRTIKDLYDCGELPVVTALELEGATGKLVAAQADAIATNGVRPVFTITTQGGFRTTASDNHPFWTRSGWKKLSELSPGMELGCTDENDLISDVRFDIIESIVPAGEEMTYDMSVPIHHSFVVDGVVSHNTSLALNYAYNNAYIYGKNIFYGIFEMPYNQLRRQLYLIHSSHGKFVTDWYQADVKAGRPNPYIGLDYRKVRDGKLTPLEFERLKIIAQDFKANSKGKLFVWRPPMQCTTDEIRKKAEMFHNKYGCDGIVLDNIGNIKPKFKSNDYVTMINSVVTECRFLALNFARGNTVPVLGLFHMNRQGKLRADKADGHYDSAAISYANQLEKDADVITYTYLNDALRTAGQFKMGCIKNRDNPQFAQFIGKILWGTKRMRAIEQQMLDMTNDRILAASEQISLTTDDMI